MKRNITGTIAAVAVAAGLFFAAQSAPTFRETSFADVAPNENDIILDPAKTYTDFYLNKGGTFEDPVIIWGNGAKLRCVLLQADYVIFKDAYVDGCETFGIRSNGDHVQLLNNTVTNVVRMNLDKTTGKAGASTSWHAGVRAADATDILIAGNTVSEVYGEGLACLRVNGVDILNNYVSDAYSVNIYLDQCFNAKAQNNYSRSSGNPNFYKAGKVARGISIGAENYGGWAFSVNNILIENNTLEQVRGINFIQEQPGTPSNVVVRDNVFVNVPAPLVSLGSWATVSNSFTATPSGATFVPTITPSRTPTLTKAPVTTTPTGTSTKVPASATPTGTATKAAPPTVIPTICETAVSDHFWFMGCTK